MKQTLLFVTWLITLVALTGCTLWPTSTDTPSTPTPQQVADDRDDDANDDADDDSDDANDGDDDDDSDIPTPQPAPSTTYTLADVQAHAAESSCRTVIRGVVYDLSAWIDKHPGGDRNILKLCGIDGTTLFEGKHDGQPKPENTLAGFEIGILIQ